MAVDKKISQLASGAPAQAGDEYVVARSGANFKLTLTNIAASMPPIGATTPNTGSFTSLTNSGNLTFSSTAQRITGDFSNATVTSRVALQTSTANSNTILTVLPTGTGSGTFTEYYQSGTDPANSSVLSVGLAGGAGVTRINSTITGTGTYLPLTFNTGGSERMRLDTSGNLGIGTTSPSYPLHVAGNTNSVLAMAVRNSSTGSSAYSFVRVGNDTDATAGVLRMSSTNTGYSGANSLCLFMEGPYPIGFVTNNAERMRITSDGELLIGTTARINATASPLQAYATTGSGIVVQMTQSGSDTISVWNSATTGDNDFIDFYTEGTATLRGNITYNRGAGQVAYNITSDVRLKENIADAVDAGDKIDAMQVRQFDWKETGNHLDYGFVAQELHNVAPHAVSKPTNDDEMWSVDYSKLVPILVKELQAVRARLAALEAK